MDADWPPDLFLKKGIAVAEECTIRLGEEELKP
jgi:hypothetical protein